jgi:hypothetical protein
MQPLPKPTPRPSSSQSSSTKSSSEQGGGGAKGGDDRQLSALISYLARQLANHTQHPQAENANRIDIMRDFNAGKVTVRVTVPKRDNDIVIVLPMVAGPPGKRCECCQGTGKTSP